MSESANFLKYMLLGIAAALLYSQKVSPTLNKISIFVFWVCVINLVILIIYNKIADRKLFYQNCAPPIRGKPFEDRSVKTKLIFEEEKKQEQVEDRYVSQEKYKSLGITGQHVLGERSIAIIGLGGIGTICAELLARAGIGRLVLIDSDFVKPRDIKNGTIYTRKDIGRQKTLVTMEYLASVNCDINIEQHNILLQKHNCIILDTNVVLDCTRKNQFIAPYCLNKKIPFVINRQWDERGIIMYPNKNIQIPKINRKFTSRPAQFFGASVQTMIALKILLKKKQANIKIDYNIRDFSLKRTIFKKNI